MTHLHRMTLALAVCALWQLAPAQPVPAPPAPAASAAPTPPQSSVGRIERIEPIASQHVGARFVDVWLPADYNPAKR